MSNVLAIDDSLSFLKCAADESFDACITDPPYGLGQREPTAKEIDAYLRAEGGINTGGDFMGKDWSIPPVALWREVYRTLKPGALVMSFAGTRTMDLVGAGIRAAGFQYVGMLGWVQGQGFPKSMDIGKAVDAFRLTGGTDSRSIKKANELRPGELRKGVLLPTNGIMSGGKRGGYTNDNPATEDGAKWRGWGTCLKPSWEPVLVFSKGPSEIALPYVPFLYCGKASTREKTEDGAVANTHVTVKPVNLMRWLVSLAVEPGGRVLDPYLGSGTTAVASVAEGCTCFGIERDPAYAQIAKQRIEIALARRGSA